jgi:hypothetical protein
MRKMFVGLIGAAAVVATLAPAVATAQGPTPDKRVFFTFSGPVAVPGVTLPAGKYMFRLPTTIASGERHVMQVLSPDGKTSYAMFFGISANRTDYPSKPEVRFMETAAGTPTAVKTWWYPGDKGGYEFVYPKEQARLLAKGTGEPVLTAAAEKVEVVTPAGNEAEVVEQPPAIPTGPVVLGEIAPPTVPVIEPPYEARGDLPKTASNTGLVALTAVAFLMAAAFVRRFRTSVD